MIQLMAATVLLQLCQNIVQNSVTSHSQSLCNEISAILGGHDALPSPIRHIFWGACPPVPAGFTPLDSMSNVTPRTKTK